MILIGNIVSENELTSIPKNFKIFNFNDWEDNGLPTLFVGWSLTKNKFPETSILNKKISNNLYWTFSTQEKRNIFETDIKDFIRKTYDDFIKKIKIFSLDPVILKINSTDELINKLQNFKKSFTYLYGDGMIYIYNDTKIITIDLNLLKFISFDDQKVLKYLKEETNFFEHKEKEFKNELKYFNVRYIPYLIFKNATENTTSSVVY